MTRHWHMDPFQKFDSVLATLDPYTLGNAESTWPQPQCRGHMRSRSAKRCAPAAHNTNAKPSAPAQLNRKAAKLHSCGALTRGIADQATGQKDISNSVEVRLGQLESETAVRAKIVVKLALPQARHTLCAPEKTQRINQLFDSLLRQQLTGRAGQTHPNTDEDILNVGLCNARVRELRSALGDQARVDKVDKFQEQKAAVASVSMTISDADNLPRIGKELSTA